MLPITRFFSRQWFPICLLFLVFFSTYLRFYNYENRWGLAYDQAHGALIARYALEASKIPLVGPFSSAGAFQTGGEWYWIVMLGTLFYSGEVIAPWIFITMLYVVFIIFIVMVGIDLEGKKFGLLVGLLATISTAQTAQSTNLTNQSPMALISLMAIWSMIKYIKTKKNLYLFFLGFTISLAPTVHMQGILLVLLILVMLIFSKISMRGFVFLSSGTFLPLVPLTIFDIQNNFVNISHMLSYYFHDQYKISYEDLGRRWLTYAGVFLPGAWGHIVGGNIIAGYMLSGISGFIFLYDVIKKRVKKEWLIISMSIIPMFIVIRYTRTPLFDSYLMVLHPFIFLLSGWAIYKTFEKRFALGLLFLGIIFFGSMIRTMPEIYQVENATAKQINGYMNVLTKKYPGDKFAVYSYRYQWTDKNLPLSLFLNAKNLSYDKGVRIGVVYATMSGEFKNPIISGKKTGYQFIDLQSSTSSQLAKAQWVLVNSRQIYEATEEWYTIINNRK